jgi:hypothetical protein
MSGSTVPRAGSTGSPPSSTAPRPAPGDLDRDAHARPGAWRSTQRPTAVMRAGSDDAESGGTDD